MDKDLEWTAGRWTFVARIRAQSDQRVEASLSGITKPVRMEAGDPTPIAEQYGPTTVIANSMDDLRSRCEAIITEATGEKPRFIPKRVVRG
jgi:hypothetical protein